MIILALFINAIPSVQRMLSQVQLGSVATSNSKQLICDLIPDLSERQHKLCLSNPDVMRAVSFGVKQGVEECQFQFRDERWNCTTAERESFDRVMLKLGSREAAFVYAITSAAIVHSIARACGKGELMECPCARARSGEGSDNQGVFMWGGCSDNINFAASFARRFIDAKERKSRDGRSLMNRHNNAVGRKVVKRNLKIHCKCHGISGSCVTRTCWEGLGEFREVGTYLYDKFKRAVQVALSPEGFGRRLNEDPINKRRIFLKDLKSVKKTELVFFEPSPDYCSTDTKTGSVGTAGRRCNRTSTGADSCATLCCGRGYDTMKMLRTFKCDCKFIWCCRVSCAECNEYADVHTCKHSQPFSLSSMRFESQRNHYATANSKSY